MIPIPPIAHKAPACRLVLALVLAAACAAGPLFAGDEPPKRLVGPDVKPEKLANPPPPKIKPANAEAAEALKFRALSGNLVKNGSFEQGRYWPYFWEPTDGYTCFWEQSGGSDGKRCIRHYTDVLNDPAVEWNAKVRKIVSELSEATKGNPQSVPQNPIPPAPARAPTKPPYYDTIAGNEGVIYLSDPIPNRRGAIYRITLDARTEGGGAPIIFVKGFFHYQGRERSCGRLQFTLNGMRKDWSTFSCIFYPEEWKSKFGNQEVRPQYFKIDIFSYWTPGNYYYDNVRLEIVGFQPYEPFDNPKDLEKEHPEPKPEKPGKSDADLKEGEFPVF